MASHAHPIPARARRTLTLTNVADTTAYWLSAAAVYLLQGAVWWYPAKEKLFDNGMIAPARVQQQFAGSLVDSIPGTSVAWGILGVLQGAIVVGLAASLLRGEFLPSRPKPVLLGALALSLLVIGMLLFGSNMTGQYDSVASLFAYFGLTIVLMLFVLVLPPYRSRPWLSSLTGDRTAR